MKKIIPPKVVLSKKNQLRQERLIKKLNLNCTLLAVLIIISMLVCWRLNFVVNQPLPQTFLMWFLYITAYPALLISGLFNLMIGNGMNNLYSELLTRYPHPSMGFAGLATLIIVYCLIRWPLKKDTQIRTREIFTNFIVILLCWGAFQLLMFMMNFVWNNGGLLPLNTHIAPPAGTEKSTAANPDAGPSPKQSNHK
ncbi:MAG: hypothetical protein RRY34_01930 [Victivallaceae bacterium]